MTSPIHRSRCDIVNMAIWLHWSHLYIQHNSYQNTRCLLCRNWHVCPKIQNLKGHCEANQSWKRRTNYKAIDFPIWKVTIKLQQLNNVIQAYRFIHRSMEKLYCRFCSIFSCIYWDDWFWLWLIRNNPWSWRWDPLLFNHRGVDTWTKLMETVDLG